MFKPLAWASAAALALSGCALAPGPALDSSRMNDNLSAPTDSTVYDVKLITPQLVYTLKQADEADTRAKEAGLAQSLPAASADYRVGPDDVLGIVVWDHPELTRGGGNGTGADTSPLADIGTLQASGGLGGVLPQQVSAFGTNGQGEVDSPGQRVAANGTIFFPTLGRVRVEGMSPVQIAALLARRLDKQIRNPQIDVRVMQYRSQRVQITGDVKNPGQLSLTGSHLRVVDAINRAGGGNPDADLQRVLLTRGDQVMTIDVNRILNRGDLRQNIVLQANDIVHVPDRTQNRVFVMGEVPKPQTVYMNQGQLSLADALSAAGSIDPMGANPRQVIVIRHPNPPLAQAPGVQSGLQEGLKKVSYAPERNKPEVFRLDMTQVDALMLATEFDMKPLDVVYVGTAPAARFNRMLSQILPTAESFYLIWSVSRGR
ncbi:polysaccharide biosynthesis/export protein [Burkholderia pseudomallei]|uniref:polysaccharide biosynthesis/export family protein n=1 Tax=Burkholderia pseudomallei TaxID=28450 RepID=UPI00016B03AA|nr:polysaccharide biosynthesis/export family protein [Burkholderia pseudomallei]AJX36297.1 polysaccharide biosynthesis/export family protein [Burkholderia pseudomallei]MBF3802595.1 polysaccharide biosynthesis/export protein [Burkholderia pseudomallei]MCD4520438.1 polysaccharide biosynthesis/export protein [Burkholderia pseudomallei]OMQ63279.1 capsular biosynthesis protein [Burkholderia pseudomallei]OMQ76539.1 capsular biosynthesis protein [Burkholderia pseudomallei]